MRGRDETGQTLAEYVVTIALIAMVVMGSLGLVGVNLGAFFDDIGEFFSGIV